MANDPDLMTWSVLSASDDPADPQQQAMIRDIDAILARLDIGIAAERIAMDALLERLAGRRA